MPKTIQVNAAPHRGHKHSGANDNQLNLRKGYRVLSIDEVEERLHRAIKTLYALPEKDRMQSVASGMPEFMREFVESYGSDGARSWLQLQAKFVPEPRDIDLMYDAFEWWKFLRKDEYQLLEARAFKISYSKISMVKGYSGEYWRLEYKAILQKVFERAQKLIRTKTG